MTSEELIKLESEVIGQTFNRFTAVVDKAQGSRIWDLNGKEYLDFFGGLAVCLIGHCHPRVVEAVKAQASKVMHTSNLFYLEPQIKLAKKLLDLSFPGKVFYTNSGAEANETAIKLTRKYAKKNLSPNHYEIITMNNSFHGRTLATLTATGQHKFHQGLEPLMLGFKYAPFNDLGALEKLINERTCAVMVEPIQGEGGVRMAGPEYFKGLRALCDKNKMLLIFDEVQTGLGRTGKMFAYQHFGVTPDIMTLAKGLGGGLPLGACVAGEHVVSAFGLGDHGTTMGGNPVACAAGLATLEVIQEENILSHVEKMGQYLLDQLEELRKRVTHITEIRGKGLIVGVDVEAEAKAIVRHCFEAGLVLNASADRTLRFLPPLTCNEAEINQAIQVLEKAFLMVG